VQPGALGLDDHSHTVTHLRQAHGLDRCRKISHIDPPAQTFRQAGLQKLSHQGLPLLTQIDPDLVMSQGDDDPASSIRANPKIKVFESLRVSAATVSRHRGRGGRASRSRWP
jgi:hypothetical protein